MPTNLATRILAVALVVVVATASFIIFNTTYVMSYHIPSVIHMVDICEYNGQTGAFAMMPASTY